MGLSKLSSKCRTCSFVEKCDHKRMEACGYLPYPPLAKAASMAAASPAAQPLLRETVDIRVNGQPMRVYKDEIEKELTRALYAHIGLQYGA